jgi:UDP-2,3-diacylglucosamine hydrolase
MAKGNKIFFLSDFHLGAPNAADSLIREKKILSFLSEIEEEAEEIFVLGDMFDFWFEYKYVVPKGFVRLLGKLALMSDNGIKIHFFVGNHDMWMNDYFQKELNIDVYFEPRDFELKSKRFVIGHGDGLGPGDKGYKFIKKIFRHPISQWSFGVLPPVLGIGLANYFSRKSKAKTGTTNEVYQGEDKEWLITYCKERLAQAHYDYFVFGHRHLPLDINLNDDSRYINLGDWIQYFSYAEFDGESLELKYFN